MEALDGFHTSAFNRYYQLEKGDKDDRSNKAKRPKNPNKSGLN